LKHFNGVSDIAITKGIIVIKPNHDMPQHNTNLLNISDFSGKKRECAWNSDWK